MRKWFSVCCLPTHFVGFLLYFAWPMQVSHPDVAARVIEELALTRLGQSFGSQQPCKLGIRTHLSRVTGCRPAHSERLQCPVDIFREPIAGRGLVSVN